MKKNLVYLLVICFVLGIFNLAKLRAFTYSFFNATEYPVHVHMHYISLLCKDDKAKIWPWEYKRFPAGLCSMYGVKVAVDKTGTGKFVPLFGGKDAGGKATGNDNYTLSFVPLKELAKWERHLKHKSIARETKGAWILAQDWTGLWIPPNPLLRYNETCFLGSHNAHANTPRGFFGPYANHGKDIPYQVEILGVRLLLIDPYTVNIKTKRQEISQAKGKPFEKFKQVATIALCHGSCAAGLKTPKSLASLLKYLKEFLDRNPKEIITLVFECHINNDKLLDHVLEQAGIVSYLYKPSDLKWIFIVPVWSTLKQMQKENKRLVIFTSGSKGKKGYVFDDMWKWIIENTYGTYDINKALKERKDGSIDKIKEARSLIFANYFPEISHLTATKIERLIGKGHFWENNTWGVRKLMKQIYKKGLQDPNTGVWRYKGRGVNGVAVDRVECGETLFWINRQNRKAFSRIEKQAKKKKVDINNTIARGELPEFRTVRGWK